MDFQPLDGLRVLSLAINLPGPLVAFQFVQMGAQVSKIEPPTGDPLSEYAPDYYEHLRSGQDVRVLDLKTAGGMSNLRELLEETDLLLTSSRPAALSRLGLAWGDLHKQYPQLVQVAIVGFAEPHQNDPGHDLTYQAAFGLLNPPRLPRTLIADIGGAQQAVSVAMGLLLARERGQGSQYCEVSLAESAARFAGPLNHGMTTEGGILGGGFPGYRLYETSEGWIAVAALEQKFWKRLKIELQVTDPSTAELQQVFLSQNAIEWENWALERDLPIVVVRQPA